MAQNKRVVRYNYVAKDREELNIQKNETLTVVDASGLWWKVTNEKGETGLVPSNYLWGFGDGPAPATTRTDLQLDEPAHMYHQPDLMMNRNGPSLNIIARAKYKYTGMREDELSLEKGDEVVVMEKEADGWWKGRSGAKIGWFPFNYVEEVGPAEGGGRGGGGSGGGEAASNQQPQQKSFICGVIALYSFPSGNPEELGFQKGDLMDVVDQPPEDPDWWEARKADGSSGLIPRNYVEIVHDAEPVFGSESNGPGQPQAGPTPSSSASHPPPPFAHEVWYHGKVARREAEKLLNDRANNGQFIVRSSETKVRVGGEGREGESL